MTNKDFKEGMEVTCELDNKKAYDAKLKQEEKNNWYIHATHNDVLQDWWIGDGSDLERHGVTNLQPKHRTIDDLECGDIIVDAGGWKRKCLGKCGEVYAISANWNETVDNADKRCSELWTIYQLKRCDFTLYQPTEEKETDIDRCIKEIEEFFEGASKEGEDMKRSLVCRLKNLKN